MTFAPKKKHSKTRSKTRTTNWIALTARKLENRVVLQYNNNEATGLAHFINADGTYKGRQVIKNKTKSRKVTRV